jgi:hypothetical protein
VSPYSWSFLMIRFPPAGANNGGAPLPTEISAKPNACDSPWLTVFTMQGISAKSRLRPPQRGACTLTADPLTEN